MPIAVPKDRDTVSMVQNAARVPEFPFAPLFRATASMKASFRFDDVDILRKFTKYPSGLEDSTAHHQALRYQLGDLTCMLRFEVDACYERTGEGSGSESLEGAIGRPAVEDNPEGIAVPPQPSTQPPMAQSMAAEIKTATKPKAPSAYMPRLWFGRTPWLIIGQHANGNFEQLNITDTAALFASWEERHQADLRKLVTVLAWLREVVREHGGDYCVAIYEKTANTPKIKVYPSHVLRKAVPDGLRRTLWDSWSTGPSAR
ncbi:hypothetical protein CcaCcLH18_12002 [Colletotrichum camelliae]|nr:hypothetical protein CcaCcLH18_12002 [Colletotrichum camelliae]